MKRNNVAVGMIFIFILLAHDLKAFAHIPDIYTDTKIDQNVPGQIDTTLHSDVLVEDRRIVIRLPKTYEESTQTVYPVLYVLDADGGSGWSNAVATVDELSTSETIPDMILIGIHNTNRNRDMILDNSPFG